MALFIYYPPASLFVAVISAATFLLLAVLGLAEVRGQHLQYSKFGGKKDKKGKALTVSSRVGMFLLYFPAFLVSVVWLALFAGDASPRFLLLACAVSVHFLKRVLEVMIRKTALFFSFLFFFQKLWSCWNAIFFFALLRHVRLEKNYLFMKVDFLCWMWSW